MGLGKQAKTLNKNQIKIVLNYLEDNRHGLRNQVIFLLSVKAGFRAKEIALMKWSMLLNSEGVLEDFIHLSNDATKGFSGRFIPLNRDLFSKLKKLLDNQKQQGTFNPSQRVIQTERSGATSPQVIVNMFAGWYTTLGMVGCSSHSGRRTFITNAARKISMAGGSLRDVQYLAGHSSLQTTERYIDYSNNAQKLVVDMI